MPAERLVQERPEEDQAGGDPEHSQRLRCNRGHGVTGQLSQLGMVTGWRCWELGGHDDCLLLLAFINSRANGVRRDEDKLPRVAGPRSVRVGRTERLLCHKAIAAAEVLADPE